MFLTTQSNRDGLHLDIAPMIQDDTGETDKQVLERAIVPILIIVVLLIVVMGALWLGFNKPARPFPNYPQRTPQPFETMPLPDDLPAPVARFYRKTVGEQVPVIHSAVMTLSGSLQFGGLRFPARMRFTHRAGYDYRHYIEALVFGYPLMKVNERYVDGVGRMELPVGIVEDQPHINSAANMAVWGEAFYMPSLFITDPRVRWQAVDDTTAHLIVPYEGSTTEPEQVFTITFDPRTDLITRIETMRYKDTPDTRYRWVITGSDWRKINGMLIPQTGTVQWGAPEGTSTPDDSDLEAPWLRMRMDDIVYNVDVSSYLYQRGL